MRRPNAIHNLLLLLMLLVSSVSSGCGDCCSTQAESGIAAICSDHSSPEHNCSICLTLEHFGQRSSFRSAGLMLKVAPRVFASNFDFPPGPMYTAAPYDLPIVSNTFVVFALGTVVIVV